MNKGLEVIETKGIQVPAIVEAVDQYNMMVQYVQTVMKKGIDYGEIPGTKKPTLLKPGAEKLQRLFKLRATFAPIDIKEDWDKPFFYYRYKCQVWHDDHVIAECEGSTNSYEKKYRYRYVFDNKATPEEKESGTRIERVGRNGKPYTSYRIENKEIFDQVNTLQKMAQKRAYVGAILLAANASEFFTQDMEDLSIVDAEFTEKKEGTQSPNKSGKTAQKRNPTRKNIDTPMSLEMAENETGSDGVRYGDCVTDVLSKKMMGITKWLNNPDNSESDKREAYMLKRDAILTIKKHREQG